MDSMPLLLMGLGFLGVFAIVGATRSSAVLAIVLFGLALVVIAFAFLYLTNVPSAPDQPRSSTPDRHQEGHQQGEHPDRGVPRGAAVAGCGRASKLQAEPHRDRR
jgi:hypothetical protein